MNATVDSPPLTEDDIAAFLEELTGNDMPCEAEHDSNGTTCSITVTHRCRLTCKGLARHVCDSEARSIAMWAANNDFCNHCGRLISTCWIVNPI